jgi:hypothetical protein
MDGRHLTVALLQGQAIVSISLLVMTGAGSCNDIDLATQPSGFIAAWVPLPNGGGRPMFVPDLLTACRQREKKKVG